MSLHIVVNGMTSGQRMRKQKKEEVVDVDIDLGDLESAKPKWLNETSLNNLNDVYQVLYYMTLDILLLLLKRKCL